MNKACMDFVLKSLSDEQIDSLRILEVGAYDHNGTVRPAFKDHSPVEYIGIDIQEGPGVDEVCSVYELTQRFGEGYFDLVINTELLEHVADWKTAINQMKAVTKTGGVMIITTRSYGFAYHGYPYDFWRYSYEDMKTIFSDFDLINLEKDPIEPGVFIKARKTSRENTDLSNINLFCILTGTRKEKITNDELAMVKTMPLEELEDLWYSSSQLFYRRYIRAPWRIIEKTVIKLVKGDR